MVVRIRRPGQAGKADRRLVVASIDLLRRGSWNRAHRQGSDEPIRASARTFVIIRDILVPVVGLTIVPSDTSVADPQTQLHCTHTDTRHFDNLEQHTFPLKYNMSEHHSRLETHPS